MKQRVVGLMVETGARMPDERPNPDALLAAGVFAAFYIRDLKPALRAAADTLHVARQILTELFAGLPKQARAP